MDRLPHGNNRAFGDFPATLHPPKRPRRVSYNDEVVESSQDDEIELQIPPKKEEAAFHPSIPISSLHSKQPNATRSPKFLLNIPGLTDTSFKAKMEEIGVSYNEETQTQPAESYFEEEQPDWARVMRDMDARYKANCLELGIPYESSSSVSETFPGVDATLSQHQDSTHERSQAPGAHHELVNGIAGYIDDSDEGEGDQFELVLPPPPANESQASSIAETHPHNRISRQRAANRAKELAKEIEFFEEFLRKHRRKYNRLLSIANQ